MPLAQIHHTEAVPAAEKSLPSPQLAAATVAAGATEPDAVATIVAAGSLQVDGREGISAFPVQPHRYSRNAIRELRPGTCGRGKLGCVYRAAILNEYPI